MKSISPTSGNLSLLTRDGDIFAKAGHLRRDCFHRLFEARAAAFPESVAIRFRDPKLTYRELNDSANRLAWHLRERGVGPEKIVGLLAPRSPQMVIGLLG